MTIQTTLDAAGERIRDRIRGCLIGGAAGDALGYAVEFDREAAIFARYGQGGIQAYAPDPVSGKALISDDTQMTLFTADGLLRYIRQTALDGVSGVSPTEAIRAAYLEWLRTQELSFAEAQARLQAAGENAVSWLCDVPELYHRRAPGNTCLSALNMQRDGAVCGCIDRPINHSKGCGGVMRVAPMGVMDFANADMAQIDRAGAEAAAITHGHSLGYMPAAVLTHIVHRIVFCPQDETLREITLQAIAAVTRLFAADPHIGDLRALLIRAVDLSANAQDDLTNIHALGEGWVGDEALAIAVYCALRYADDFSAGIIAAVNHKGDSDSTGAIAGNILGAWAGLRGIDAKWQTGLELADVILTVADDLYVGGQVFRSGRCVDADWNRRYARL